MHGSVLHVRSGARRGGRASRRRVKATHRVGHHCARCAHRDRTCEADWRHTLTGPVEQSGEPWPALAGGLPAKERYGRTAGRDGADGSGDGSGGLLGHTDRSVRPEHHQPCSFVSIHLLT